MGSSHRSKICRTWKYCMKKNKVTLGQQVKYVIWSILIFCSLDTYQLEVRCRVLWNLSISGELPDFFLEMPNLNHLVKRFCRTLILQKKQMRLGDEGTKMIPQIGVYGPLISAVTLWPGTADLLPSLKQIKATTNNFDPTNKLVGLMETQSQGKYQTSLGIG
ncbi:uncharacterized protein [Elaeis guineensis]|uniref:uncharacterized protein isoform X3 n=1 Tax=Elaeis guineensis var. tenera TaxID=51953 RepID=UPI003C6D9E78